MLHKHHIIPRHMGGTDDPSNIVELTVQEHADAHNLLYALHGKREDKLAELGLLGLVPKADMLNALRKGVPRSAEVRQKISSKLKGVPQGPKHTVESKAKISAAQKGKIGLSGSKNGNAVRIKTPNGVYDSMVEAAEAEQVSYATARGRARNSLKGWSFLP